MKNIKKAIFDELVDIKSELAVIGFTKEAELQIDGFTEKLHLVLEKANKSEMFDFNIWKDVLSIYEEIAKSSLCVDLTYSMQQLKEHLAVNIDKLYLMTA